MTNPPIAYTVIGGFLGAGKTTLINAMLATADERLAVIVNDIGDVNIDAALLASATGDSTSGNGGSGGNGSDEDADTIELTNGCVCCSVGDSLASTLRALSLRDVPPTHIVLECSGAADPGRAARYGSRRVLAEPIVVVVVDATDVRARADDPRFRDLIDAQLSSADQLIVTKADLVTDDSVKAVTGWLSTRSTAAIAVGHPGQLGVVVPAVRPEAADDRPNPSPPLQVETHRIDPSMDLPEIESWLDGFDGLVRAKGIVETAEGPQLIQWAAGRFTNRPWTGPMTRTGIVTIS